MLLGILQSRLITYYIFKKFGEIDASQAFSKLTHERLANLPIPVLNRSEPEWRSIHDEIVHKVDLMLRGEPLGGSIDWQIEGKIHQLYGLGSNEDAYINQQLGLTAYHKAMQQLFPSGPPPKPIRTETIHII